MTMTTVSIVAADRDTGEIGMAVQAKSLSAGTVATIRYGEPPAT